MEYRDYYKILGVDRKASDTDIRSAFRQLARKYHPDMNPGDQTAEERFKDINEAYEVLSDKDKRSRYDQNGALDWQRPAGGGRSPGGYRVDYTDSGGDMFSDLFRSIFGGQDRTSTRRQRAERPGINGKDLEVTANITLEDAYQGTTRTVRVGSRSLEVKIPAGAREGTRVRLNGLGEAGFAGGRNGDLYVNVHLLDHPLFRREEDDLYLDLKVPLYTAVLGGAMPVPTLDGDVTLNIRPGTQSGQHIRLRGKGMPRLRFDGDYGDLLAHILIQVPVQLSDQEKKLFGELRALRGG